MMKTGRKIILLASMAAMHSGVSQALSTGLTVHGWNVARSVGASPRPWLRQKKGRGAQ